MDSAGTSRWHVGEPAHPGTREVLDLHGIEYLGRSRQITDSDLTAFDYLIVMDSDNLREVQRLAQRDGKTGQVRRLLDYAPRGSPQDVPDPYYVGGFDHVYRLVEAGCQGLLDQIRSDHGL